ncbi:probable E3 ubiquitin-protein ligase MID2, partial [Ruditapes philippinarum]|uniref:probable E3 ubiquitin-protein ligase MID2 n=1 Tax=Ruditapes philippinarum TaxID=129788 RepID=UPI00295BDE8F
MADGGVGSDEFINFKCCLCEKKNIKKEADIYCVECQDYYCTPCTDLHKMFPAMSTHQFIDKSSFNTVSLQKSLPSFPVEKCEVHKSELLDMYCADHDDVACATCIAIKHRTCQHIHSIPDEVDDLCKEIDADKTNIELIRIKTKIEEAERAKKLLIKELNVQKEKATESIRQFRKEMEVILDTLEKVTLKTLEEKYKNGKEKLENEIKNLHRHIDELKLSSQKLTKSFGNKAQEFVAVKTSRKQIIEANEAEAEFVTNSSDVKVEFIADSTKKDALKDFKAFGLISVSTTENIREKMYVMKSKKQVNIKHQNDRKTCYVTGSCFTDDGLLFLADYDNKTLKLIDLSSESIKDRLNLEASPLKICQISKNEFA